MKTYVVKTDDSDSLRTALGRMIEYTKFLEEETGRTVNAFSDQILEEEEVEVDIIDN